MTPQRGYWQLKASSNLLTSFLQPLELCLMTIAGFPTFWDSDMPYNTNSCFITKIFLPNKTLRQPSLIRCIEMKGVGLQESQPLSYFQFTANLSLQDVWVEIPLSVKRTVFLSIQRKATRKKPRILWAIGYKPIS